MHTAELRRAFKKRQNEIPNYDLKKLGALLSIVDGHLKNISDKKRHTSEGTLLWDSLVDNEEMLKKHKDMIENELVLRSNP